MSDFSDFGFDDQPAGGSGDFFGGMQNDRPGPDVPLIQHQAQRPRFYFLMFLAALLGGAVGTWIASVLYSSYAGEMNNYLLVGLIAAVLSGCILLACILCEVFRGGLGVRIGAQQFLTAVAAAIVLGGLGAGFEFLYELGTADKSIAFDDYIFLIDDSGSMEINDGTNLRYDALTQLLDTFDQSKRVGVVRFSSAVDGATDLGEWDQAQREEVEDLLSAPNSYGGTDISDALDYAMSIYQSASEPGRSCMVVLMSDGQSDFNVSTEAKAFTDEGIVISSVGLGDAETDRLTMLAEATGGTYYSVSEASGLAQAFQQVQVIRAERCLFAARNAFEQYSVLWMVLRVLFLAILGALLGLALNLVFRHHCVERQLIVACVTGLLSGLAMEGGFLLYQPGGLVRGISWMLYSIVLIQMIPFAREAESEFLMGDLSNETLNTDAGDGQGADTAARGADDRLNIFDR